MIKRINPTITRAVAQLTFTFCGEPEDDDGLPG